MSDYTFASNGAINRVQLCGLDTRIEESGRWFRCGILIDDVDIDERSR